MAKLRIEIDFKQGFPHESVLTTLCKSVTATASLAGATGIKAGDSADAAWGDNAEQAQKLILPAYRAPGDTRTALEKVGAFLET